MRLCWFLARLSVVCVLLSAPSAQAHLGSLNAIYEGLAGNIPVRVIIRPPGVVPGLAEIDVRILTNGVQKVSVLPVHWRAGLEGAPPPDTCEPVPGEADLYHAQLWLMASGAYSVHVNVETSHGSGRVIVPVNSLATTRLNLSTGLTVILAALGGLLFLLAISVIGAAVRDSVLEPGQVPSARRRWIGRGATFGAGVVLILMLWGGKSWWDNVDRDYRNNRMFKPVPVTAAARWENGLPILRLTIDHKKAGNTWSGLVPDHGKLMHAFLVREGAEDVFAHLHPGRRGPAEFESLLPLLPPGRYRIFADVTHETGFAQTLTATVNLSETTADEHRQVAGDTRLAAIGLTADPDDSFWIKSHEVEAKPETGSDSTKQQRTRGDGLTFIWENPGDFRLGGPGQLRFRVLDSAGHTVQLEPYMGMLSHLIIVRSDEAVFTHLHPAGNISMASQQVFQIRAGDRPPKKITPAMMEKLCQLPSPEMLQQPISFPYEFPGPGRYRLWIQVKYGGKVRTELFGLSVGPRS